MISKIWGVFMAWLKRVEARADAWAHRRLSPEEWADAVALDRRIKSNFWRVLGMFAGMVLVGVVLVFGISSGSSLGNAVGISIAVNIWLVMALLSPWYGYRKWMQTPAWKIFAVLTLIIFIGGVTGFMAGTFKPGKPLLDVDPQKLARALAFAMLIGIAVTAILVGISRMRMREALERGKRLEAEAERERLARHGMQAELKLLQAQVEPHFLFNTLASVRHLVQTGSPDALVMLDHLIHYLRTALPEIRSEGSTLGREAELARAYLEIIRIRMGGGLQIEIDVPDDVARAPFPPLMLMTLVENAIKHGVAHVGHGRVSIRAAESNGRVRVQVTDDGRGFVEPIGRGVGLANVRERLQALYADAAQLDLSAREAGGTVATIEVPA
jgi:signal transduction histidine kinase